MVDGLKARQQKDWMDSLSSSLLLPLLGHRHGPNACVKRKCEQEVSANRGAAAAAAAARVLFQHTRRIRNAFRWNAYVCTQRETGTGTDTLVA